MGENKHLLWKSVARFGLIMGLYWIFKYIFYIGGVLSQPWLILAYMLLTFLVLFLAYAFSRTYKFLIGGKISFFHAWQFGVLVYFFAALTVSLFHYVFYRYMVPADFMAVLIDKVTAGMDTSMYDDLLDTYREIQINPIRQTIQGIYGNIFYGVLFSLPVALLVCWNDDSAKVNELKKQPAFDEILKEFENKEE